MVLVFILVLSVNIFLYYGRFLTSAVSLMNVICNVTSCNVSLMPHKNVSDFVKIPHVMQLKYFPVYFMSVLYLH